VLCCSSGGAAMSTDNVQDGSKGRQKDEAGFSLSKEEKQLLELINAERKKHDLAPLRPSPALFRVARAHSANMAKQGKMAHVLDDKTPYDRIKAVGYKYRFAGENIGRGDVSLPEMVKAWMDSKVHRDNILHKEFTETGLGVASDAKKLVYYTQVFAKPQQPR
jgi:uncharacterized protein YkwD